MVSFVQVILIGGLGGLQGLRLWYPIFDIAICKDQGGRRVKTSMVLKPGIVVELRPPLNRA